MSIFRQHKSDNFSIISNHCLRRKDLSWKAKGIYAYLMSLPDDWELLQMELVNHAPDGKTSVRAGINELIKAGYIITNPQRSTDGKTLSGWEYHIYEFPNQTSENQTADYQTAENQPLLKTNQKPKTKNTKEYDSFLENFNKATGRNLRVLGEKAKRQYNALIRGGYAAEDIVAAAKACANSEFFKTKGNLRYLTPEYITRPDKFSVYHDDGAANDSRYLRRRVREVEV